jgi:hypothetical protein
LLAADQGHAESQEMIAIAYFNGFHNSNREPNFDLFIKYAKMGANQGIVDCQIMLADFYLNYEICLPIAHCWFEKAAHMNCAIAQHMLGRMYSEGLGVAKDELKSIHWFERAMENKYDASRDPHSLLYDATRDPHSSLYEDSDFENENNEKVLKSLSPKDKDMQIDECSNCGKTTNLKLCARCQMQNIAVRHVNGNIGRQQVVIKSFVYQKRKERKIVCRLISLLELIKINHRFFVRFASKKLYKIQYLKMLSCNAGMSFMQNVFNYFVNLNAATDVLFAVSKRIMLCFSRRVQLQFFKNQSVK